ncbi:MAG: hypothetical protein MJE63_20230 [Proteobacteria bacterium]|nr:hypothetical protein [Pseudomonadota bacterium]
MKDQNLPLNRIDQVSFWIISLAIIIASILLVYFPRVLENLLREDGLFESCGAFFFLSTGFILMTTSVEMYKNGKQEGSLVKWRFLMVLGAGILFFLAFGEEISWGQRIFQFETPEMMEEINRQGEMNLHNLDTRVFNNAVETIVLLMILIPTIWIHRGKNRLLGFLIPSYWMILSLQLVASYVTYNYIKTQDYTIFLVLAYFIFVNTKSKQWVNLFYVLFASILIGITGVINANLREMFPSNGPREFREFLYAFIFLVFSIKIYLDVKRPAWANIQI